jgi:hypothetical protein
MPSTNIAMPAFDGLLIGAGLLSVLLFPLIGLTLLKRGGTGGRAKRTGDEAEAQMAM